MLIMDCDTEGSGIPDESSKIFSKFWVFRLLEDFVKMQIASLVQGGPAILHFWSALYAANPQTDLSSRFKDTHAQTQVHIGIITNHYKILGKFKRHWCLGFNPRDFDLICKGCDLGTWICEKVHRRFQCAAKSEHRCSRLVSIYVWEEITHLRHLILYFLNKTLSI